MEGFTDEGSRIIRGLRGMSARKDIDREWLEDHYVQKHMSARACAELCGTSHTTVVRNLKLCGIQIRTPVGAKDVPEDWLEEHYIHKRLSAYECGILCGASESVILRRLKQVGIPARTNQEAQLGRHASEKTKQKMSVSHKGRRGWWKGKHLPEETRQKMSNALSGKNHPFFGKSHSLESRQKISTSLRGRFVGEDNPSWNGGTSFEPYCPKFNGTLKEEIRNMFGRRCFLCGVPEKEKKHHVHHVDYNKNTLCNGKMWGLVPLCNSCHAKTNHHKWAWFSLLNSYWAVNPSINFLISPALARWV